MNENNEGWGWPVSAVKPHYFVDGRSLCRRWMWLGGGLNPPDWTSSDDCVTCARKLEKRLARKANDEQTTAKRK